LLLLHSHLLQMMDFGSRSQIDEKRKHVESREGLLLVCANHAAVLMS